MIPIVCKHSLHFVINLRYKHFTYNIKHINISPIKVLLYIEKYF